MFGRLAQRASRLSSTVRASAGRRTFASGGYTRSDFFGVARSTVIGLGGLALGIKILSDKEKEYRQSVSDEIEANANVAHTAAAKLPAEGLPGTNYERTFIASKYYTGHTHRQTQVTHITWH